MCDEILSAKMLLWCWLVYILYHDFRFVDNITVALPVPYVHVLWSHNLSYIYELVLRYRQCFLTAELFRWCYNCTECRCWAVALYLCFVYTCYKLDLWIIKKSRAQSIGLPVEMDLHYLLNQAFKDFAYFHVAYWVWTIYQASHLTTPKRLPAQPITHIFDCCVCRRMWFNNCSDNQWRIGDDFISCSKFGGGYHSSKFDCNVEFILLDWFSQGVRTPWFSRVSVIDTKSDMQCYSQ